MKKKIEKFSTCTFCLSKMCKLLGVWAVPWLLPVQVSRFTFGSRDSPKTPGLSFPKYPKFYREILFKLNFVYNHTSGDFVCVFCLL